MSKRKATLKPVKKNSVVRSYFVVIIPIIGFIIYSNIFDNSFHFDDIVWRNLRCIKELDISSIFNFAPLRFISFLSFALNFSINGYHPNGYYLLNIIIHIINSILVWKLSLLIISLLPTSKEISNFKNEIALFTALIFLCHPMQTQAVSYIYQRIAALAAMFYFLATIFFILGNFKSTDIKRKRIYYTLMIISILAALFTKENTFSIIIIIPLILFFLSNSEIKLDRRAIVVFAILVAGIIIIIAISDIPGNIFRHYKNYRGEEINNLNYLLTQFKVILHYFRLAIIPYGQSVDHDVKIENSLFTLNVIIPFLIHLLILIISLLLYKKERLFTLSILWIYFTLAIESSIIPIRDVMFEHRFYLSMFGFSLLISGGIFYLFTKKGRTVPVVVSSGIIIILSYLAYNRNIVWENDITLWTDVIKQYPDNARAYNARGMEYLRTNQISQAIDDFREAIKKYSKYTDAYANLGNVYFNIGQYSTASEYYTKALDISKNFEYYYNRGNSYFRMNEFGSAIKDYSMCLKFNKKFKDALKRRADARIKKGELFRALKDLKKALEIDSSDLEAIMMAGEAEFNLSKYSESLSRFSEAIRLSPANREAYTNRATVNFQLGNYIEALNDFNKAIYISPRFIPAYKNLGLTYEKLDNFEKAIETYNQALIINNRDFELYYLRGNAYLGINNFDSAIKDFKTAVNINPDYVKAKNKLFALKNHIPQ